MLKSILKYLNLNYSKSIKISNTEEEEEEEEKRGIISVEILLSKLKFKCENPMINSI